MLRNVYIHLKPSFLSTQITYIRINVQSIFPTVHKFRFSFINLTSIMSKPILYYTPGSPPARAVLFLIRHLNLDVEVKTLNLLQREQYSEEFLKLNPAHEVPLLVDGDFVLSESRAILAYLVNSRKAGSDLYPTNPQTRARVDQRLSYDHVLFYKNASLIVSIPIA